METFKLINGRPTIDKDPNATLDYIADWTEWLDVYGDTLASVTATPTDVTVVSADVIAANKKVRYWVSGGTPGSTGSVTLHITTNNVPPRTDDRTFYFKIKQR